MTKREKLKITLIILLIIVISIVIFTIIYNINLNNTIKVVTQEVKIDNLPKEFENFTILQLTDLHSKEFGENESELISLINSLDYDAMAITGDMGNYGDSNYEPLIELLKGIENKDEVFYTPGNHGPFYYEDDTGFQNFIKSKYYKADDSKLTDAGKELKELGVKYLNDAYDIKRGDSTLWISELIDKEEFNVLTKGKDTSKDIKIALTHYPMDPWIYEGDNGNDLERYDLVMAGHYHGGQWRIPLLGAFIIPDINSNGWFPEQDLVCGLTEYGGFKQYVSKGLGAGGPYKNLRFRLFNQPEIDLIKLVKN